MNYHYDPKAIDSNNWSCSTLRLREATSEWHKNLKKLYFCVEVVEERVVVHHSQHLFQPWVPPNSGLFHSQSNRPLPLWVGTHLFHPLLCCSWILSLCTSHSYSCSPPARCTCSCQIQSLSNTDQFVSNWQKKILLMHFVTILSVRNW